MEFQQNKELLSNTLALNVALQTIKERCVHLQKRLYALESENSRLRLNSVSSSDKLNESRKESSLITEVENLRAENAELTLQKCQLTENLSMISTENRKLWKRLSHLTKENGAETDVPKEKLDEELINGAKHANLIRSKTFTQNSPHQLLREKIAEKNIGPEDDDLEDISLINDCNFSPANPSDKFVSETGSLCDIDTRACAEGLFNIKRELLKQNSDLKVALSNCRKLKNPENCPCKTASKLTDQTTDNKKPQMNDKMVMTDNDLTLEFFVDQEPLNTFDSYKQDKVLADLIEKKNAADQNEKICPMCGKFYTQHILFDEFLEHVESHFTDSDIEQLSLDHNFELVSHSVGNF